MSVAARRCRVCQCTDTDCSGCVARTGRPCRWIELDLCSACLFVPPDLEQANEKFKANCGPMSFAAFMGKSVTEIMKYFPYFPARTHTNGRQMQDAFDMAGLRYFWVQNEWPRDHTRKGVAWLQLGGRWMEQGIPMGAQLARSHWVAFSGEMIFDPNAPTWLPRDVWEETVLSAWIARQTGADGSYFPRKCFCLHREDA